MRVLWEKKIKNLNYDTLKKQYLQILAKEGFEALYDPGDVVYNRFTNQLCRVSIKVIFRCDLDAIWTQPDGEDGPGQGPTPLFFQGITNTSCQINMVVPYAGI